MTVMEALVEQSLYNHRKQYELNQELMNLQNIFFKHIDELREHIHILSDKITILEQRCIEEKS